MKSDIDITSGKVIETDEDSAISVHFMDCDITYPPFTQQNNKDNHNMLYKRDTMWFACAVDLSQLFL